MLSLMCKNKQEEEERRSYGGTPFLWRNAEEEEVYIILSQLDTDFYLAKIESLSPGKTTATESRYQAKLL